MVAIAWALFTLMAGLLGLFASALFVGMTRIDGLRTEMNARFDNIGTRIDNLGVELRAEIRDLRGDISALDARLTRAGG